MAVNQTPPDESIDSESAAPDTGGDRTDAESAATAPADTSARTADTSAGSTAGGSPGGDSTGRIPPASGSYGVPDTGFFGWMRSLGVPRLPGWLGGVAAGVSARLSIDPIIVRGVLVVCALFGVPVFLLYGLAWLLLPDTTGRIHLEQLLRGVFDKALVGIAILVLLGLSPFAIGGSPFSGDAWDSVQYGSFWTSSPWVYGIRFLWTLALIGAVTALIIWLVRRNRASEQVSRGASTTPEAAFAAYEAAASDAADAAAGAAAATAAMHAGSAAASVAPSTTDGTAEGTTTSTPDAAPGESATAATASTEPVAPAQPSGADQSTDEYEAWKAQHAAWRIDHEAWRQSQADANRAARAQLAADNKVRAAAFAARADEARRLRKLTRPRTSFAYIVATLGAGLVAGSIAAIAALSGANSAYAITIGLGVAALVAAIAMIVAGLLRRRSGFLAFVTVTALVLALGSAAIPRTDQVLLGDSSIELRGSSSYLLPAGTAYITASKYTAALPGTQNIDITMGAGNIYLDIRDGATVKIDAQLTSGYSSVWTVDENGEYTDGPQLARVNDGSGDARFTGVVGGAPGETPGIPDATITIHGLSGGIQVTVYEGSDS